MGRPKKQENYMEETTAYSIRVRKDVLNRFLETYKKKKRDKRINENKGYYINGLFTKSIEAYIKENEDVAHE